jgi:pilus assembly protein Flp/PilA
MKTFWQNTQQFLRDEEGVTAIEYGLIAALIAVVIIAAVKFVGTQLQNTFSHIGTELQNANTSTSTTTAGGG